MYPSVRRVSLFGGLKLKLNVLGMGGGRMEIIHPVKRGGDRVEILHLIACILGRSPRVAFVQG